MPKQHKQKLKTSGKDEFVAKFISVHKRAEKHCTNSLSRSFPTIKKREGLYTDEVSVVQWQGLVRLSHKPSFYAFTSYRLQERGTSGNGSLFGCSFSW